MALRMSGTNLVNRTTNAQPGGQTVVNLKQRETLFVLWRVLAHKLASKGRVTQKPVRSETIRTDLGHGHYITGDLWEGKKRTNDIRAIIRYHSFGRFPVSLGQPVLICLIHLVRLWNWGETLLTGRSKCWCLSNKLEVTLVKEWVETIGNSSR